MTMQLLLAFVMLGGFCVSGVVLMRVSAREAALRKRVSTVLPGANAKMRPIAETMSLKVTDRNTKGLVATLTSTFGFDMNKLDHYPYRWWVIQIGCVGVTLLLMVLLNKIMGPKGALLFVPVWIAISQLFFRWCNGRRREKLFRQFPDALAMIVRSVRVGIPVSEAVRAVARDGQMPTAPEFGRLADEVAIGMSFDDALFQMAERNGLPEYRFFATALSLQNQTGGALSETLENLADVIRKRVMVKERGNALAAEAKTSAMVLAALPVLALVGLYFLNPDYIGVLFTDKTGNKLLAAAAIMLLGGMGVMRMIIVKSLS